MRALMMAALIVAMAAPLSAHATATPGVCKLTRVAVGLWGQVIIQCLDKPARPSGGRRRGDLA